MNEMRHQYHANCVVCSPDCEHGLQVPFAIDEHGVAMGSFSCNRRYQGYPGMLHGGIISALLDGAMTNCLFLHGHAAVTAELVVRFRHPVIVDTPAQIRAWVVENGPLVFRLKAQLEQAGTIKVVGRGIFMQAKSITEPSAVDHHE
jgi:acyl-coenzyme A thioesterase PaaI-like protein